MDLIQQILIAALLGFIQGLTEFLPVSSSGHLEIAKLVFGFEANLFFSVLLHAGTLVALLTIFHRQLLALLAALGRLICRRLKPGDESKLKLILIIFLATLATIPFAILIEKYFLLTISPKLIGVFFILTAIVLVLVSFFKKGKDYSSFQPLKALIVGIAQGVAVLPGISRSGFTISASLATGLRRQEAAEFSFLLSIPAILGALIFELKDASELFLDVAPLAVLVGCLVSFLSGLTAIVLLRKIIKAGKLWAFSFYLLPLGVLVIVLL